MQISQSISANYSNEADTMYFKFSEDKIEYSYEYKDIILDTSKGKITAIEIPQWKTRFQKKTNVPYMEGMDKEIKIAFIYIRFLKLFFFNLVVGKAKYEFFM